MQNLSICGDQLWTRLWLPVRHERNLHSPSVHTGHGADGTTAAAARAGEDIEKSFTVIYYSFLIIQDNPEPGLILAAILLVGVALPTNIISAFVRLEGAAEEAGFPRNVDTFLMLTGMK